jgi:xanthine dehydrogenase accessory factor
MQAADLNVLLACQGWMKQGRKAVLLTVLHTWGSSPRPPGAMMAIRDDAVVTGSVSGGCIEDDLIDRVRQGGIASLCPGNKPTVVTYGIEGDEARRFGIPCGGTLQLVLEPLGAHSRIDDTVSKLQERQTVRRDVDMLTGAATLGPAPADAEPTLQAEHFSCTLGPRNRLIVIGAGQLSRYLCEIAVGLDFDVTVCDPREEYRAEWNIPGVHLTYDMPDDVVLAAQPDARTAIVALTHDPKLDDMALMHALQTDAFYVGALGSRANNGKRRERLRQYFDITETQLARLHGPAGLYIGSRTPPEIALSILAEIVAYKNGVKLPESVAVGSAKASIEQPPRRDAA